MTDFDFDVVQKKRIARGAFNRKCGSKSKICSLSTDYMSRREWEKKNGAIVTYNINKPMKWHEFKNMPVDLQVQYLKNLRLYYDANMAMIRDMFGISQPTFRKHIEKNDMESLFSKHAGRPPETVRARWAEFCSGEETIEEMNSEHVETEEDVAPESDSVAEADIPNIVNEVAEYHNLHPIEEMPKKQTMSMHHFTLCFNGKIDPDMIANSIRNLVGSNTIGRIDIHCDLEG